LAVIAVASDSNADDVISGLFERLDSVEKPEPILKFVAAFEQSLKNMLHTQRTGRTDDSTVNRVAKVAWSLEERGLLRDEIDVMSLMGSANVLMNIPIAELLLKRLAERQVDSSRAREKASAFLARGIIKSLMDKLVVDQTRHIQNAYLIQTQREPHCIGKSYIEFNQC
jgi:hypothetical protein